MNIPKALRGALRRVAGATVPAFFVARMNALSQTLTAPDKVRKTLALPAALTYSPRAETLPKPTPANLRKFGETPVARKAINSIKDRVAGMKWRVQARNGRALKEIPDGEHRAQILTDNLDTPNHDDSFRSLSEQVLEDVIVGGFGAVEVQL